MRIKGISIWEQHVEKIILGVAALVFVGFTAMQFIGDPNAVEKGATKYTPSNVDEELAAEADRVERMIADTATANLQLPEPNLAAEEFRRKKSSGVSPSDRLARVQAAISPQLTNSELRLASFHVPDPPAPAMLGNRDFYDALANGATEQYPELGAMQINADAPPDVIWITTFASYPASELMAEYRASDGGKAVPSNWIRDRVFMLDVITEREKYVDGEWVQRSVVSPNPSNWSLREDINGSDIKVAERDDLLEHLSTGVAQQNVIQPPFYPTRNSAFYVPDFAEEDAIEIIEDSADKEEIIRLSNRIKNTQREVARRAQQLDGLGGPLDQKPGGDGGDDRGGAGDGGGWGGGGSGGGAGGDPPSRSGGQGLQTGGSGASMGRGDGSLEDQKENEMQRWRLTVRLRQIEARLARLQEQLQALTGEMAGAAAAGPAYGTDPNTDEEVVVWTHDIDVEPGESYRYRTKVQVYNPFFYRRQNLIEEQKPLSESLTLESPWSTWSEPIEVSTLTREFLVQAEPPRVGGLNAFASDLGLGKVVAEVYKFYDGRWWTHEFTLQPGDRVGGQLKQPKHGDPISGPQDYSTEWFVLDIVADVDAEVDAMRGKKPSGKVILQNIRTQEISEVRIPRQEERNMDRLKLRDEVLGAESLAEAQVSAE